MVLGLKGLGRGESRASVCSVSVIGIIKNNHINHILTDEIGSQAAQNCQRLYLTLPIGR